MPIRRCATLVAAHLRQRPSLDDCPAADAELEIALRRALAEPGSVERFPRVERAPWPVPLWLYPGERWTPSASAEDGEAAAGRPGRPQRSAQARRARRGARQRAQPAAVPPGKPAQLVGAPGPDRCSDDEERTARASPKTLDYLSLSRQRSRAAACA